jgi:hypothetical protein
MNNDTMNLLQGVAMLFPFSLTRGRVVVRFHLPVYISMSTTALHVSPLLEEEEKECKMLAANPSFGPCHSDIRRGSHRTL